MMAGESAATVADADVRTLAAKLKGLHALVTPAEQVLLHTVLRCAAGRTEATTDAAGVPWATSFNPFSYLDMIGVDGGREQQTRGI